MVALDTLDFCWTEMSAKPKSISSKVEAACIPTIALYLTQSALTLDPQSVEAMNNLGMLYAQTSQNEDDVQVEEAIRYFKSVRYI